MINEVLGYKIDVIDTVKWLAPTSLCCCFIWMDNTTGREVLLKGRLSTVGLFVRTCLDQFLFILSLLFTFFNKQTTLMRRWTVLSLPASVRIPCFRPLAHILFGLNLFYFLSPKKANGRGHKSWLGQVFNFKLGCFVTMKVVHDTRTRLALNTRPKLCPVILTLSIS